MITIKENNQSISDGDFSEVLLKHGLGYKTDDLYHSVSFGRMQEYKVLSISVVQSQIREVLEVLVPFLMAERLSFRLVKNQDIALWILNGLLSYGHIGKTILIHLPSNRDFGDITKQLIALTKDFKGPEVPNEFHLGGLVYLTLEEGEFVQKTSPRRFQFFKGKYILSSNLKSDPKGDVWEGTFINGLFGTRRCIIKEGRRFMCSDPAGRDMKDRLEWQHFIHQHFAEKINIPAIFDLFEDNGNTYLITEFIKGKTLRQMINETYAHENWIDFSNTTKVKLLHLLLQVIYMLQEIHEGGYIHRDLNPSNFILTSKNKLYIIDLELAYSKISEYPLPAFGLGTLGFMSPEQMRGEVPTEKEDIYGLGALMMILFTGAKSVDASMDVEEIQNCVYTLTREPQLSYLIRKCLSKFPGERPDLKEIEHVVEHVRSMINF